MNKNMLEHNKLDGFFTEALLKNKPNWDMETIRTAALICSNALLLNNGYPAHQKTSDWIDAFLDEVGREVSVMGLHNYGYSATAQKYLAKKGKQLGAYIEQEKQADIDVSDLPKNSVPPIDGHSDAPIAPNLPERKV